MEKKKMSKRTRIVLIVLGAVALMGAVTLLGIYAGLCHFELSGEPVYGDIYDFNADAVTMVQEGNSYIFTNNFVGDGENKLMYAWYIHIDGEGEPAYRRRYTLGNQFKFTPPDDGETHIYEIKAWVLAPDGRHKTAYCYQTVTSGLDCEYPAQDEDVLNPIYLIITVDVEDERGGVPNLIEGDLGDKGIWGVDYIMEQLEKRDMHGVFFTNVYENVNYTGEYEGYMEELVRRIDSRGHEVALHSHENPLLTDFFDKTIDSYEVDRQTEIIEYGCSFIENATGRRPISYRGGSYIANDDTYEALRRCGIRFDSTSFYFHYNNRFSSYAAINQSFAVGDIIEFPVISIYDRSGKENKLDIDRLFWQEVIDIIRQMQRQEDFPAVQIMFHSFTFLEHNPYGDDTPIYDEGNKQIYDVDVPDYHNFEALLDAVAQDDTIQVVTFRELAELGYTAPDLDSDAVFCVPTEKGEAALAAGAEQ